VIEFGIGDEFMRPLSSPTEFNSDPLIAFCAAMEHLEEHEYAVVQVLFTGTHNPWAASIMRSVTDNQGGSFLKTLLKWSHLQKRQKRILSMP